MMMAIADRATFSHDRDVFHQIRGTSAHLGEALEAGRVSDAEYQTAQSLCRRIDAASREPELEIEVEL